MTRLSLIAAAVLASTSGGWAAETAPAGEASTKPGASATNEGKGGASAKHAAAADPSAAHLPADMARTLAKAGFTDVDVLPDSILVRAKDKDGNPVAMVLNPRSMTEIITLDPHAGSAAAGNGAAPLRGSGTFVTVLPTERLATSLIGLALTDRHGGKLGVIKDLAVDHGGVHAYIVGVGGLFGIGDRYVAVAPGALHLTFDPAAKIYRASIDATVDQLKAAPEFRYDAVAGSGHD